MEDIIEVLHYLDERLYNEPLSSGGGWRMDLAEEVLLEVRDLEVGRRVTEEATHMKATEAEEVCERWEELRHDLLAARLLTGIFSTLQVDFSFSRILDDLYEKNIIEDREYDFDPRKVEELNKEVPVNQFMVSGFLTGNSIDRERLRRIVGLLFRKTPDNFIIERGSLILMDYASSFNPRLAINNKLAKYGNECRRFKMLLDAVGIEIDCSTSAIVADLINNQLLRGTEHGVEVIDLDWPEYFEVFGMNIRQLFRVSLSREEAEAFEPEEEEELETFYELGMREATERIIAGTGFNEWLEDLKQRSREPHLFERLYEMNSADSNISDRTSLPYILEPMVKELMSDLMAEAESMDNPFEVPSPEEIKRAFKNFHGRIRERNSKFLRTDDPKPNFHFAWPISSEVMESELGDTKRQVMINLLRGEQSDLLGDYPKVTLSMALIVLANLSQEEFRGYQEKGLVCDVKDEKDMEFVKEVRGHKFGVPKKSGKKKRNTVYLKKPGEDLEEIYSEAKIDMPDEDKAAEKAENAKQVKTGQPYIESLPFWDVKQRRLHEQNWKEEKSHLTIPLMKDNTDEDEDINWLCKTAAYRCLSDVSVLFKNIMFTAQTHRRNRFSIATGPSPYQAALVLPGEDLQSSNGVSFCHIYKRRRGQEVISGLREKTLCTLEDGHLYRTQTVRLDKVRLKSLSTSFPKFVILFKVLVNLIEKRRVKEKKFGRDKEEIYIMACEMAFYSVTNVNINTSSLMDNVRYLVLGAAADYSGASAFIEDKMEVAIKTTFQMHLYDRTLKLLSKMHGSKLEEGIEGIEGAYFGNFWGLTGDDIYSDLVDVIQESYAIFFSVEKGMHNKFHNMVSIHKTAFDYQQKVEGVKDFINLDISRGASFTFNPKVLMLSSFMTNSFSSKVINRVRRRFNVSERPFKHPLTINTMSSLKKCAAENRGRKELDLKDMDAMFRRDVDMEEEDENVRLNNAIPYELRGTFEYVDKELQYKKQKKLRGDALKRALKSMNWVDYIDAGSRPVLDEAVRLMRSPDHSANGDAKLNYHIANKLMMDKTMEMSLDKSLQQLALVPNTRIARVVPKMQRTQKDREIYLVSIQYKTSLYFIEHFMKQVNKEVEEEWITIPGDQKFVELFKDREGGEGHSKITGDCSKFSAEDNQDKFIFNIVANSCLTRSEKTLFFVILYLYTKKRLLLSDDMCSYLRNMSASEAGCIHENPFFGLTDGLKRNYAILNKNWLQGQLNYLSSNVHACCARLIKKTSETHQQSRVSYAVHSDDFKVNIKHGPNFDISTFLCLLDLVMNLHTLKLNYKKSSVHKDYLEMVSQIIYHGEARPSWVKSLISVVSALPYTGFEQDRDATVSKVATALSNGCPPSVASVALRYIMEETSRVYSMHKTGANSVLRIFNKSNQEVPTFLGGWGNEDTFALSALGSKAHDVTLLVDFLKGVYSGMELNMVFKRSFPLFEDFIGDIKRVLEMYPELAEILRGSWLLKVFSKRLSLIPNEAVEDWDDMATVGGLFRFKRFVNAKMKYLSWLYQMYPDDEGWTELKKDWMLKNPSYSIVKPQTDKDLLIYYRILLDNSAFLRSYTNQSQEQLLINRVRSSKDKIMSLPVKDLTIHESAASKSGIMSGDMVTIKEGLEWFRDLDENITNDDIVRVVTVWLISNTRVPTWLNVITQTTTTSALYYKQSVPRRMPKPEGKRVYSAPVTTMLQYLYDIENFRKDGKELIVNDAVKADLSFISKTVKEIFGDIAQVDLWKNLRLLVKFLTADDSHKIYMMPTTNIGALSNMMSQIYRSSKNDFFMVGGETMSMIVSGDSIGKKDNQTIACNLCKRLSEIYPHSENDRFFPFLKDLLNRVYIGDEKAISILTESPRHSSKNFKIWHYILTGEDLGISEEDYDRSHIAVKKEQIYDESLKGYRGPFVVVGTIRRGQLVTQAQMEGVDQYVTDLSYTGSRWHAALILTDINHFVQKKWKLSLNFNNLIVEAEPEGFIIIKKVITLNNKKNFSDYLGLQVRQKEGKEILRQIRKSVAGRSSVKISYSNMTHQIIETHFVAGKNLRGHCTVPEGNLEFPVTVVWKGVVTEANCNARICIEEGLLDYKNLSESLKSRRWAKAIFSGSVIISEETYKESNLKPTLSLVETSEHIDLDSILNELGLKNITLPNGVLEQFTHRVSKLGLDLIQISTVVTSGDAKVDWVLEDDMDSEEVIGDFKKLLRKKKITEDDMHLMKRLANHLNLDYEDSEVSSSIKS
uniref:RNA-dependent RNA polymerase n=1 Tax=Whenzhou Shrimp Virus 2 TaxID=1608096 RepID=A0A0B5KTV6_9VIRU|nr:RNA-dependent RNA polymerase [Whenzhou Shrimp Virus 2]